MADVIRIKRRSSGGAGAPATLAYAELAYNEIDDILYYGKGNNAGQAQVVIPIAGPGFASGGGGSTIAVGDTPPASPPDSSLWFETDSGTLWLRFNDSTSTQWIAVGGPTSLPNAGLYLPLTGGAISGSLSISNNLLVNGFLTIAPASGDANIDLRKATATAYNTIYGRTGTSARWIIIPGGGQAESGLNVGSDFFIQRCGDNGVAIDNPLTIKRSNGAVTIPGDMLLPGPGRTCIMNYDFGATFATRKGYIDGSNGNLDTEGQISGAKSIIGYAGAKCFIAQGVPISPQASMLFRCPAQPVNQRDWELLHDSNGKFQLRTISDDYLSATVVLEFLRGSGIAVGRCNLNTPVTITGNTFSPSANPGAAALLVSGSYGGGIMHNDGGTFAGHWTDSFGAALRFGCGGTASSIAQTFYITTTQTLNISGAWNTISDISTKQNVEPYTRGLSAIIELEPVVFSYIKGTPFARENDDPRIGLIAQQVQPHVPEIVGSTEITIDDKPQTVSTLEPGTLIFAMINGMKEIVARLEAVEAALKNV